MHISMIDMNLTLSLNYLSWIWFVRSCFTYPPEFQICFRRDSDASLFWWVNPLRSCTQRRCEKLFSTLVVISSCQVFLRELNNLFHRGTTKTEKFKFFIFVPKNTWEVQLSEKLGKLNSGDSLGLGRSLGFGMDHSRMENKFSKSWTRTCHGVCRDSRFVFRQPRT